MGDVTHFAIVVVADHHARLMELREKAEALLPGLVSPIVPGRVNAVESFYIAPDGSHLNRPDAAECRAARKAFLQWLKALREEEIYQGAAGKRGRFKWTCVAFGDFESHFWTPEDRPLP